MNALHDTREREKTVHIFDSEKFYSRMATATAAETVIKYMLHTFAVTTHTAAGGAVNISFFGLGHQSYNANTWKCSTVFCLPLVKNAGYILWFLSEWLKFCFWISMTQMAMRKKDNFPLM